jgi:hypothetical protein
MIIQATEYHIYEIQAMAQEIEYASSIRPTYLSCLDREVQAKNLEAIKILIRLMQHVYTYQHDEKIGSLIRAI